MNELMSEDFGMADKARFDVSENSDGDYVGCGDYREYQPRNLLAVKSLKSDMADYSDEDCEDLDEYSENDNEYQKTQTIPKTVDSDFFRD
ncbi:hypothetical protein AGMMS49975_06470 [Clostridia bacterium]|nr:hypothetical protein AGMMS49975_06470 [Clostridia bacterium]